MPVKKSRTPSKPAAKTIGTKYEYTELGKASASSAEAYNFYGVIIDATFPYKKGGFYICSLKVIDPTKNTKDKADSYSSVVLYANKFEDLPIVHRIGDIIRVHRANLRIYGGKHQFNCNLYNVGSWVLYSADSVSPLGQACGEKPYAYSGKKSTQESQDAAIIKQLKKWTNAFFAQNNVVAEEGMTPLAAASNVTGNGDFDVVAKVLQILPLDQYTNELKLRDQSGTVCYTLALRIKFPHLKTGSVVYIRSCTYDATCGDKKVLIQQHYSNMMTFISSSKFANKVASKVSDDKSGEKAALKSGNTVTPVVLTEVDKKHQNLPTTRLTDLFHDVDTSSTTFRTCFTVMKVEPGNVQDCVKSFDKKSKKVSSAKGAKGGDLIYQVQFLVKDPSVSSNNNVYRVLLYTHEGLGANFFPVKATNLWSDKSAATKVSNSIDALTRFNTWVDCVVERRHGYYFIKDTKMVL